MTEELFKDQDTKEFWEGKSFRQWKNIEKPARRRLKAVILVRNLQDLANTPGNRLEKLIGNKFSIRVSKLSKQYRVVFQWNNHTNQAYNIEINAHDKKYGK